MLYLAPSSVACTIKIMGERLSGYRQHYICLTCRASFKGEYASAVPSRCPHCAVDMIPMGRNFKAPRKRATAQWKKLEFLVRTDSNLARETHPSLTSPSPKTYAGAKAGARRKDRLRTLPRAGRGSLTFTQRNSMQDGAGF
jgi:DNA-directed RNA polymerase subunit RPC12/RpoP